VTRSPCGVRQSRPIKSENVLSVWGIIHKKQLTASGLRSCNSSFRTLTQPLPKGQETGGTDKTAALFTRGLLPGTVRAETRDAPSLTVGSLPGLRALKRAMNKPTR